MKIPKKFLIENKWKNEIMNNELGSFSKNVNYIKKIGEFLPPVEFLDLNCI